MVILGSKDLYEVKLASLIADYDRKTLTDLYMPIVGHTAICIYFVLWSHADSNSLNLQSDHEHLLVSMQIPTGKFVEARKKLEGIGLLRTNLTKENDYKMYTYTLYAPKTPGDFFSDTLLYGLLIKYLGEKAASRLKNIYNVENSENSGKDITATFAEVFNPDFNDPFYKKALLIKKGEIVNRIQSQIDSEFNFKTFKDLVTSHMQVNKTVFTKSLLKEIERLAMLFGVNETDAAVCFESAYHPENPAGKKVDMDELKRMFMDEQNFAFVDRPDYEKKNLTSSDTILAQKLNWMEEASCKDFLQQKQGNRKPALADLKLVDDISTQFGLIPPVINAILEYALANDNNRLSRNYIEKIAGSVGREKCKTAYDTLNFLNSKNGMKISANDEEYKQVKIANNSVKNVQAVEENDDSYDPDEWQKFLKDIGA